MRKRYRRVCVFCISALVTCTLFQGCADSREEAAGSTMQYEPEKTEYEYQGNTYIKEQHRSFEISYPKCSFKRSRAPEEIELQLSEDIESYYKPDTEKNVYYVVRTLVFTPFYHDETDRAMYFATDASGNGYVEDEQRKEMKKFKLELLESPAFLSVYDTVIDGKDTYISEAVEIQPTQQEGLRYNFVMEFDCTEDAQRDYRQPKEIEDKKLCELLNQTVVSITAFWKYDQVERTVFERVNNYFIETESDGQFSNITLNKLTTTSQGIVRSSKED